MAQKRSDDDHRASEKKRRKDNSEIREKNQKRKTQRRKDPDFLEDEKMKKKDKRTNPEDRIKEGQLRRVVRNGPKNRKNIRVDNRNRILKYRKDVLSKITENLAAKQRMRALRRKKECINLKNFFLAFRRNWESELKKTNDTKAAILLQFIKDRALTPKYVCVCCEGLFFRKSVSKANLALQTRLRPARTNIKTDWICSTCRLHAEKNKTNLPRMAVDNGFQFPEIPDFMLDLTPLEERMLAPILMFMQIRPLMPNSLNPQLGLKGSVVNIPVEVPEMINSLPRTFDNMDTVQVKLKRHINHRSDYMFETVRPWKLRQVMEYLDEKELYKKLGITLKEEFIRELEIQNIVNFVVNPTDLMTEVLREIKK